MPTDRVSGRRRPGRPGPKRARAAVRAKRPAPGADADPRHLLASAELARTPADDAAFALDLVRRYRQRHFEDGLVLYAGANLPSPASQRAADAWLGAMPAGGRPGVKDQPGSAEVSALEIAVERQLCDIFGAAWADARPASGTMANLAVYAAFLKPGDTIAAIAPEHGGHYSHHAHGAPVLFGAEIEYLPFDTARLSVDDAKAAETVRRHRPRLVMLGASLFLFPYRVPQTVAAARDVGAKVVYDAAHVAGLIAGGRFQNPLEIGADIVTASTYKTMAGGAGGFVFGRDQADAEKIRHALYPVLTTNYDAGRLTALAVTLAETRAFMADHAAAVIANARALADGFRKRDIGVLADSNGEATATHQVAMPVGDKAAARAASQRLEQAGIFVGASAMPGAGHGLRFGSQIATRRGMGTPEMDEIAAIVAGVLGGGALATAKRKVRVLARRFRRLAYCFRT